MTEKVIMAGFGGQGIMSIGQMLAYAGMSENKSVTWLPSYGPEMRGGTANCHVIVSDNEVASPVVNEATAAIIMNKPSLVKFQKQIRKQGFLLVNSSLIDTKADSEGVHTYYIPANEVALELGNKKIANMVMLGAYISLTKVVNMEAAIEALKKVLGQAKNHLVAINVKALIKGADLVRHQVLAV